MAILQASDNKEHTFDRPPLDRRHASKSKQGSKRSNFETIHSLLDLVDFNAARNPNHGFCLQELKHEFGLHEITFKGLADAVGICTAWLTREIAGLASEQKNGEIADQKPAAVALLMGSDIALFIYILALMRLGIPVH